MEEAFRTYVDRHSAPSSGCVWASCSNGFEDGAFIESSFGSERLGLSFRDKFRLDGMGFFDKTFKSVVEGTGSIQDIWMWWHRQPSIIERVQGARVPRAALEKLHP